MATFVDPALVAPNTGAAEPLSDYSATIFWGDNTSSTGSITTTAAGTYTVLGSHLYAEEDAQAAGVDVPYAITVVASHDKAVPVTMTSSASVSDPAVIPATGIVTFSAVDGRAIAVPARRVVQGSGRPGRHQPLFGHDRLGRRFANHHRFAFNQLQHQCGDGLGPATNTTRSTSTRASRSRSRSTTIFWAIRRPTRRPTPRPSSLIRSSWGSAARR